MDIYKVKFTNLNLLSTPGMAPNNIIGNLPKGQLVLKIEAVSGSSWWKITTKVQGYLVEGFLNKHFLVEFTPNTAEVDPLQILATIPQVHLITKSVIKRSDAEGRAYPLNEHNLPRRVATSSQERKLQIAHILKWLNVEKNIRYLPGKGSNFCNIYAYDYCFLAGSYIPRVWWTRKAIALIASGKNQKPEYGNTVLALNANSLCNWFEEFGPDFGWRRTISLNELQMAANEGQICIIVAQRTDLSRSGHICAVVPELEQKMAKRAKNGGITIPLQSQAGSQNYMYGGSAWWTSKQFRKFGFWIHA